MEVIGGPPTSSRRRRGWPRTTIWQPLAVLTVALVHVATLAAQALDPAYQLKAAVVSKFPEFTEWPESALKDRKNIELCVAGPHPFANTLNALVAGETLKGRALVTREIDGGRDIESCQLLFVALQPTTQRRELLARAAQLPVLTVGDSPQFLDEGGIINLRLEDGRVRFEVNLAAANGVGIRLSSQFLRLAKRVRGGPS